MVTGQDPQTLHGSEDEDCSLDGSRVRQRWGGGLLHELENERQKNRRTLRTKASKVEPGRLGEGRQEHD